MSTLSDDAQPEIFDKLLQASANDHLRRCLVNGLIGRVGRSHEVNDEREGSRLHAKCSQLSFAGWDARGDLFDHFSREHLAAAHTLKTFRRPFPF